MIYAAWAIVGLLILILMALSQIYKIIAKLNSNFCKTAQALTDGNAKIHEELIGIRYDNTPAQQEVSRGRFIRGGSIG